MKKLEPGMLCRVVGAKNPDNEGKIVELIRFVGTPPLPGPSGFMNWYGENWWEIDRPLVVENPLRKKSMPYADGCRLQPINPDHQPADEEWQADFKRLLSGGEKAKEKPLDRIGARG